MILLPLSSQETVKAERDYKRGILPATGEQRVGSNIRVQQFPASLCRVVFEVNSLGTGFAEVGLWCRMSVVPLYKGDEG